MNILVIGDSITAAPNNYVDMLREKTGYHYVKFGYPGKSSTYIKEKLMKLSLSKYSKIIIECGINNVDKPDVVIQDLKEISHFAKRSNSNIKIIILTLPPYKDFSTWTLVKQKNLEKINDWILSYEGATGVDIYTSLSDNGVSKYSIDKLHPNKKGHEIMTLEILKAL